MKYFTIALLLLLILVAPINAVAQNDRVQAKGYSKLVVENCHEDRVDVRVWVAVNGGAWHDRAAWKDRGLLSSQWSGSDCPASGTALTIELDSGTITVVKAIDSRCGRATPLNTLSNCHVLTTRKIRGDALSRNVYTVRVGEDD